MAEQYLSDEQLGERYGVNRVSIWRWHRERPDFPRVIKLTPGCARWRLSEIEAWEASKAERAASRADHEHPKEVALN
ncbi:MAG: AlpA family transcriptional regulator [Roseovarius sp.]|nr:AlpA family transcriptional regulator [Roseovarius sp.]MBK44807.1 AlpA family transcriptional regulator [Roseovarius sp.]|tara:strand:- start:7685 stop:7915 length:231 start_codon:yes stop_codon:yes gene_type:complete